jgi:hypothetical protein
LKAPGTERLKLKSDKLLSSFGFTFDLRRYNLDDFTALRQGLTLVHFLAYREHF